MVKRYATARATSTTSCEHSIQGQMSQSGDALAAAAAAATSQDGDVYTNERTYAMLLALSVQIAELQSNDSTAVALAVAA
jgi:hypothetical protein